jgi:hypothetical protein
MLLFKNDLFPNGLRELATSRANLAGIQKREIDGLKHDLMTLGIGVSWVKSKVWFPAALSIFQMRQPIEHRASPAEHSLLSFLQKKMLFWAVVCMGINPSQDRQGSNVLNSLN